MSYLHYPVPCDKAGCQEYAIGEDARCEYCYETLCRSHYDETSHTCYDTDDEQSLAEPMNEALEALDEEAIIARVSALRPDRKCSIVMPRTTEQLPNDNWGGFNLCIDVPFDDGVTWILKVPYTGAPSPPREMIYRGCESQVATYRTLHACGMLVPQVYAWGVGELSKPGAYQAPWILYEKMPGTMGADKPPWTGDIRKKYIDGWAAQSIILSSISFDKIGALGYDCNGEVIVGSLTDIRDTLPTGPPYFDGPFETLRQRHTKHIDNILRAIEAGTKYRDQPLQAYLGHLRIREIVSASEELGRSETEFFLQHADARTHNLLVTEENEISAILDWEWALTTTKNAAFGAPIWYYVNTHRFLEGYNDLYMSEIFLCDAYKRMGRPDLAECVPKARLHQRLEYLVGQPVVPVDEEFVGHLRGLAEAAGHVDDIQIPDDLQIWTKAMMARYAGTIGLDHVIKLENEVVAKRKKETHPCSWPRSWPRLKRCSADSGRDFRRGPRRRDRGYWHAGVHENQKKEMLHLGKKM